MPTMKLILIAPLLSTPIFADGKTWECGKFEGGKIIASDGSSLWK